MKSQPCRNGMQSHEKWSALASQAGRWLIIVAVASRVRAKSLHSSVVVFHNPTQINKNQGEGQSPISGVRMLVVNEAFN